MADKGVDISKLPQDVREKLAELDLELSEGKPLECTQILTLERRDRLQNRCFYFDDG